MRHLLLMLNILFFTYSWSNTTNDDPFCSDVLTEIQFRDRLLKMREEPSSYEKQKAIDLLLEANSNNQERLNVFGDAFSDDARTIFRKKISSLIEEFERGEVEVADVEKRIYQIYGETMKELDVRILHLEDTPLIANLWRKSFQSIKVRMAQADRADAIEFWLNCADPETTFVFLDARIYNEILGPGVAKAALEKGFKHVYMASDEINLDLAPGLINLDKQPFAAMKIFKDNK